MHRDATQSSGLFVATDDREAAARLRARWLEDLTARLTSLPAAERDDLVREFAAHLDDAAADAVGESAVERLFDAMQRLGTPEEIARPLLAEGLLRASATTLRPLLLGRGLLASALTGLRGLVVALAAGSAYISLFVFVIVALCKPFFPDRIGLFVGPDGGWRFGIVAADPVARDPLGLWVMPLAVVGASLLYLLLTRALGRSARRLLQPRA